ncbi:lytic transglycosylase domain-containing protein [Nitrosophilus labii]|uniref:lytic transglycosylase domain-containing protein n=1 Tax=Nitrosophilus labii TaxID=2706014 RepID=UPI0016569688|nr:lytic transglycosylase domain-containing protein [Nitrosophilus labii]
MKKLILMLPLLLFSKEVTLDFITQKPTSVAKDYYIWRFLDQNITSNEANKAFYQTKNVNRKIFLRFAKKSDDKYIKEIARCMKLKPKEYIKENAECIAAGMSPYKFVSLDLEERKKIAKKVKKFEKTYKIFTVLSSKYPFFILLNNEYIFFNIFNQVGDKFREKHLNYTIPTYFLEKIKNKKGFDTFVNIAITNPKLKKIHFSFFDISTQDLSAYSSFLIAINAIRYSKYEIAKRFLIYSYNKAYYTFDKDKALFWLYLITKNPKILEKLTESKDINIYSIYAKERLHKKIDNFVTFDFENNSNDINIKDPFVWLEILNKTKSLKEEELKRFAFNFRSKNLLPVYAFLMERYYKYKIHPYITPFESYLKGVDKKDRALIYALARQESRFIPSSISTSFALGTMQIMPFLAKAIAKEKNIDGFDLDLMFEPKINLDFALHHIKFLKRKLKHPLLIAYAYNGGIGFTKRKIVKTDIFDENKFEPFLGMELVPYPESRKYGKKVLANYVIYCKILGVKENLHSLIEKLVPFDRNHRF